MEGTTVAAREFTTSLRRRLEEEEQIEVEYPIEFVLDGETLYFMHPTASHMAIMAVIRTGRMDADSIGSMFSTVQRLAAPETWNYLQSRLLDPSDPFEIGHNEDVDDEDETMLSDIVVALFEEYSGRPTLGSSASSKKPSAGGPSTKAGPSRRASTSSPSRRASSSR